MTIRKSFIAALILSAGISQVNADPLGDLRQNLSSADPAVRTSGLKQFTQVLGTVKAKDYAVEAIPVLLKPLSDSDVQVRRLAIGGLLMVAGTTAPVIFPTSPGAAELTANPVREAVLKATSDPDAQVRQTALEVYALTYKLSPDLERKIIDEFNSIDPADPRRAPNKVAMIGLLMIARSPSAHATEFLTRLLDDPKYAPHVAQDMAAGNCPLSDAALDKLATKLAQDKEPGARGAYARAIGVYGKRAQRYVPRLQAALAQETDESAKQNLQAAIQKTQ